MWQNISTHDSGKMSDNINASLVDRGNENIVHIWKILWGTL